MEEQSIHLGKTDIMIPPMGIGTWAWGDRFMWGFGRGYSASDVKEAFETSLAAGIYFFDTAEVYGSGKSESLLGSFASQAQQPLVIATKFFPFPWRLSPNTLVSAMKRSLNRLGMKKVELYQVHWPFPPLPVETWAEGLARVIEAGLTTAAGVSNFSTVQMRRACDVLARHKLSLASNQVEYSLLDRSPEKSGLLQACKDLGITLIAYSPIAKGMLSGKYTPENPPPGVRGRSYNPARLAQIQPLIQLLRDIGQAHEGKTSVQVSLNWLMCKGSVPIPGAKNARQAQDLVGALGWRLTTDEVAALDDASDRL